MQPFLDCYIKKIETNRLRQSFSLECIKWHGGDMFEMQMLSPLSDLDGN